MKEYRQWESLNFFEKYDYCRHQIVNEKNIYNLLKLLEITSTDKDITLVFESIVYYYQFITKKEINDSMIVAVIYSLMQSKWIFKFSFVYFAIQLMIILIKKTEISAPCSLVSLAILTSLDFKLDKKCKLLRRLLKLTFLINEPELFQITLNHAFLMLSKSRIEHIANLSRRKRNIISIILIKEEIFFKYLFMEVWALGVLSSQNFEFRRIYNEHLEIRLKELMWNDVEIALCFLNIFKEDIDKMSKILIAHVSAIDMCTSYPDISIFYDRFLESIAYDSEAFCIHLENSIYFLEFSMKFFKSPRAKFIKQRSILFHHSLLAKMKGKDEKRLYSILCKLLGRII